MNDKAKRSTLSLNKDLQSKASISAVAIKQTAGSTGGLMETVAAPEPNGLSPYHRTEAAAAYLRVSDRTLQRWRLTGGGPPFIKAGRTVLYRQDWLDAWAEARRYTSTSDTHERR